MMASQRSILSYLKELASEEPNKQLLGNSEHWLSAGMVLSLVEHVATALHRMRIGCGVTVGVRCTRTMETAILLLGLRAAGALAVLFDPREDVQTALQNTEADITVQAIIEQTAPTVFCITREGEKPSFLDLFLAGAVRRQSVAHQFAGACVCHLHVRLDRQEQGGHAERKQSGQQPD